MRTHGMRRTPEWNAWQKIISRCENQNADNWAYYGGRGITICREWRESFEAFFAHIGPRPSSGHSVDRIDGDGNYEPGNVRWATRVEQRANRRPGERRSHFWAGKRHEAVAGEKNIKAKLTSESVARIRSERAENGTSLSVLAREFGVSPQTISHIVNFKTWKP